MGAPARVKKGGSRYGSIIAAFMGGSWKLLAWAAMEMHQVRYFLALCKELNFTRAARRCAVSQPSLTNAIKALEEQLGGALFHRRPRVALTELGRTVRPHLRQIARKVERARAAGRAVETDNGAILRQATCGQGR